MYHMISRHAIQPHIMSCHITWDGGVQGLCVGMGLQEHEADVDASQTGLHRLQFMKRYILHVDI